MCDWPAAYVTSEVVHILLEEILGFHVVQTGPGPNTVDAWLSLFWTGTEENKVILLVATIAGHCPCPQLHFHESSAFESRLCWRFQLKT